MSKNKIHGQYNFPTVDDFFERTHGSYMGRIEKIKISRSKFENIIPQNVVTEHEIEDFILMCVKEYNKKQRQKDSFAR